MTPSQSIKNTGKGQRNSNFELLRVLSMLFIVGHHFSYYGIFTASSIIPTIWNGILLLGGGIGVNTFALISGFFLIDDREICFPVRKTVKLWTPVFFYSVAGFALAALLGTDGEASPSALKALFPLLTSEWWFASAYFVLLILHPYLNRALLSLKKTQYQKLLLFLLTIWGIIPFYRQFTFYSGNFTFFAVTYVIAGYIKRYGLKTSVKSRTWFLMWLILSLLNLALFLYLYYYREDTATIALYLLTRESLPALLRAICLFMAFAVRPPKHVTAINVAASSTFGIYLLHENRYVRNFLWKKVFFNPAYQGSALFIPYSIVAVMFVFVLCMLIELGRIYAIEKPFMRFFDAHADDLIKPFTTAVSWVQKRLFGDDIDE